VKKIIIILSVIALTLILTILAAGFFLYYKGPNYVLKKVQEIASEQYQIKFQFDQSGFFNKNEVFLTKFSLKHKQIDLAIHEVRIRFLFDWKTKSIEIQNFDIIEPKITLTIEDSNTKEINPQQAQESSLIEEFLLAPSSRIILKQLNITNLSVNYKKNSSLINGKINTQIIELHNMDFAIRVNIFPGHLNLNIETNLKDNLTFSNELPEQIINLMLSKLNLKAKIDIERQPNEKWVYHLKPLELSSFINKIEIQKNSLSTIKSLKSIKPFLTLENFDSQLELLLSKDSKHLFQFDDFIPTLVQWKLTSQSKNLKSAKARNYLTPENTIDLSTQGQLSQSTPSFRTFDLPFSWNFSLNFKGGPFRFENEKSTLTLETQWNNNLGQLNLKTNSSKLLNLSAKTEMQSKQTQAEGLIQSTLPFSLMEKLVHKKIGGKLSIPFHVIYEPQLNKNKFNFQLDTKVSLKDFNYEADNLKLIDINGEIPILEKLQIDTSNNDLFSFQELFIQNPFERVDYNRIDPFIRSTVPLRIGQIKWLDKTYGPFEGIISLEQNFISIHNFSLNFIQGSANGELFIDLFPKNKRTGFLGRITNVDLADILPQKYLPKSTKTLPFSSRTGIVLSLVNKTLNGRMDITQLGGKQLSTFINLVDPNYLDEKMNKIRSWLEVGSPTQIRLGFNEGNMDMDLDISALGLNQHQAINGISIQSFIDKALTPKKEDL